MYQNANNTWFWWYIYKKFWSFLKNLFLSKKILFFFLTQGQFFIAFRGGGKGERNTDAEKSTDWLPSHTSPDADRSSPGSTLWPFGLQEDAPTNWATPAEAKINILNKNAEKK